MTAPTPIRASQQDIEDASHALLNEMHRNEPPAELPILMPAGEVVRDPAAQWLIDHVEAWQVETQEPRIDAGWFHASSLYKSDAELLAAYRGENTDCHKAGTLRIFDNGHSRDADWKRYLFASGLSRVFNDDERRIRFTNIRLTGECDDIIMHPVTGEQVVFEFKTINPFAFGQLRAPKPEHVMQVHAYMAGLALDAAIICYENKANQAVLAFHVAFDLDVWTGITRRLHRLLREAHQTPGLKANTSAASKAKAAAMEV